MPPGVEKALETISNRPDLDPIGGLWPESYYRERVKREPYPKISRALIRYLKENNVVTSDGTPAHEWVLRVATDDE